MIFGSKAKNDVAEHCSQDGENVPDEVMFCFANTTVPLGQAIEDGSEKDPPQRPTKKISNRSRDIHENRVDARCFVWRGVQDGRVAGNNVHETSFVGSSHDNDPEYQRIQ